LVIHKNKYWLFYVIFLLVLQFVFYCSNSYTYEYGSCAYAQNQVNKYNQVKHSNKVVKNAVPRQTKTDKSKKQLDISDFSGKKDSQDTLENIQKEKPSSGINFVWTLFALFIVLAIIVFIGQLFNRLKNTDPAMLLAGKFGEKSVNRFNILSTASLGQGKNIHLVEINGKHLVIGSTINNISFLAEIDPVNKNVDQDNSSNSKKEDNDELKEYDNDGLGYDEIYKEYLKDKDTKSNQDNNDL